VPEFEARLRKVGDSMGVIIPHQVIEELGAKLHQRIRIVVPRTIDWSDVWGRFHPDKDTDQLLRSARTRRD
jgi:antitoxin component of MazEF toxin-antitoxin module